MFREICYIYHFLRYVNEIFVLHLDVVLFCAAYFNKNHSTILISDTWKVNYLFYLDFVQNKTDVLYPCWPLF